MAVTRLGNVVRMTVASDSLDGAHWIRKIVFSPGADGEGIAVNSGAFEIAAAVGLENQTVQMDFPSPIRAPEGITLEAKSAGIPVVIFYLGDTLAEARAGYRL